VLARDLAGHAPTIEESWTGGAVLDLCAAHPAVPSFAVVEGQGKVIGLIERERLYFQFSQPLWFDVYNRRPIAPLVTRAAMVVDGAMPIEGVKELIAYRYPQAIASGFAIVDEARYLGIGTMTALLEKTVDLAHRRAIELEQAHRQAEIASQAKSRFLATMSHELRTPQRHHRLRRAAADARCRAGGAAPRLHRRHPEFRRAPARAHQRHPRLLEARGRATAAERNGVRPAPAAA
jgi:two-component system cell cycle sensor histidine kinase PleC